MKGRPSLKTPELIATIIERYAEGDRGIEGVCEADDMPAAGTVFRWLSEDAEFHEAYTRARAVLGEVQGFRAMGEALGASDAAIGRLRYDARRWAASRLAPKNWGDKVGIVGGDGVGAVEHSISVAFVAPDKPA